jgi:hypothetical protein
MSRELRILAIAAAALVATRAIVLIVDNAIGAWRKRGLYE